MKFKLEIEIEEAARDPLRQVRRILRDQFFPHSVDQPHCCDARLFDMRGHRVGQWVITGRKAEAE